MRQESDLICAHKMEIKMKDNNIHNMPEIRTLKGVSCVWLEWYLTEICKKMYTLNNIDPASLRISIQLYVIKRTKIHLFKVIQCSEPKKSRFFLALFVVHVYHVIFQWKLSNVEHIISKFPRVPFKYLLSSLNVSVFPKDALLPQKWQMHSNTRDKLEQIWSCSTT